MALQNFNDLNVNNWFQTIETNSYAWEQLANDLENDFLNAIQNRFIVNQEQIAIISQIVQSQKELITSAVRVLANFLKTDPSPGKKVQASVLGVVENPPQAVSNIKVEVDAGIKKNFTTGQSEGYLGIKISCNL